MKGIDQKGVTLMETLVVIGIMTVLLLVVTQIFALNYDIFWKQSKRSSNETGAVLAAKTVSQMARGAIDVEASHLFGSDTRTSSSSALVLKLPTVDSSGNVVAASFDYIAFYRDATTPTKIMAATDAAALSYRASGTRLITDHNEVARFMYNNPDITKANRVSLFVVNRQSYRSLNLTTRGWTSIFLRNYE
jgi:prepilin-type N-terminal cleavage/methylation domain-containing protein